MNLKEYMMGNLAALGGSATWLLLATFLKMPISGTHSIVGAVLGFSLVARGFVGINWFSLGKIGNHFSYEIKLFS
jgi:sodium-dependent phosphate transporter